MELLQETPGLVYQARILIEFIVTKRISFSLKLLAWGISWRRWNKNMAKGYCFSSTSMGTLLERIPFSLDPSFPCLTSNTKSAECWPKSMRTSRTFSDTTPASSDCHLLSRKRAEAILIATISWEPTRSKLRCIASLISIREEMNPSVRPSWRNWGKI